MNGSNVHISRNRKGETLVSAIVGSILIALAVGGIASVISANQALEENYLRNNAVFFLQHNASAAIRRLNTENIGEGEVFYLKKDVASKNFLILTGAQNGDYRYVNAMGEWVNTGSTTEKVFLQSFLMERKDPSFGSGGQIIRAGIKELIRK